jgi:hypothetical protein
VARHLTLRFRRWNAFAGRRLALLHRRDPGDAA